NNGHFTELIPGGLSPLRYDDPRGSLRGHPVPTGTRPTRLTPGSLYLVQRPSEVHERRGPARRHTEHGPSRRRPGTAFPPGTRRPRRPVRLVHRLRRPPHRPGQEGRRALPPLARRPRRTRDPV